MLLNIKFADVVKLHKTREEIGRDANNGACLTTLLVTFLLYFFTKFSPHFFDQVIGEGKEGN